MLPKKGIFFYFIVFCASVVQGQTPQINVLDSLSGELIKNIRNNEGEECYLTTDKSIYKAGETVWFRVFVLRSASQKISSLSKTVFVDLVNKNDSVARQILLYARPRQLNGRFILPDSLVPGYYWLR